MLARYGLLSFLFALLQVPLGLLLEAGLRQLLVVIGDNPAPVLHLVLHLHRSRPLLAQRLRHLLADRPCLFSLICWFCWFYASLNPVLSCLVLREWLRLLIEDDLEYFVVDLLICVPLPHRVVLDLLLLDLELR